MADDTDRWDSEGGAPAKAAEAQPQEAQDTPGTDGESVTLVLTEPFYQTSFTCTSGAGDTLVIDRHGSAVPAAEAADITDRAAAHGVVLTRKEH